MSRAVGVADEGGLGVLFYVTGLSGVGKSAVLAELRARGYLARGVDEDGYADWISCHSGLADKFPADDGNFDFHAWYRDHEWVLSARRIGVLSRAAARLGVPVFLCGNADGLDAVRHLFDTVIALVADASTLRQRITSRSDNQFGQAPEELAIVMRLQPGAQERYRRVGAVLVDAAQSLDAVVDQVLKATGQKGRGHRAKGAPRSSRPDHH